MLNKYRHKNIVTFLGAFCDIKHGVILEFMEGGSLGALLHTHTHVQYSYCHVSNWARQALDALEYLHTNNVIHRDLKPLNMLLSNDFLILKLSDFGTVREINKLMTSRQGTPVYRAPEVNSKIYDHRCDIYSFGAVLWELFVREIPCYNKNASPNKIKLHPEKVKKLVKSCWSDKRNSRPTINNIRNIIGEISCDNCLNLCAPLIDSTTKKQAFASQLIKQDGKEKYVFLPTAMVHMPQSPQFVDNTENLNNNIYTSATMSSSLLEYYCIKQLSKNDLQFVKPLGTGNFGRVDKYQVKDRTILSHKFVAVKTTCDSTIGDINEIRLLGQCKHINIVHCFGYFEEDEKISIVMELMDGDLHSYLLDSKNKFTQKDAFNMLLQVCKGMQYLISCTIIHCDLAARNCLMSMDYQTIKIVDFSLGQKLYDKMYYRQSANTIFAPKWTSLECLVGKPFTEKSDVWSFGVLMWEVLSRQVPYNEIKEFEDLVDFLNKGQRLKRPIVSCSTEIYELMLKCWKQDLNERLTFGKIREQLEEIKGNMRSDDDSNTEELPTGSQSLDSKYYTLKNVELIKTGYTN